MKKNRAVFYAFIIGILCFPSRNMVMAGQNEGETVQTERSEEGYLQENFFSVTENDFEKQELIPFRMEGKEVLKHSPTLFELGEDEEEKSKFQEGEEDILESKSAEKEEAQETEVQEPTGMEELQIPQKLEVILDPWELDKKGQIYSEEYVIQNTGNMTGVLTLSHLSCKPQRQSEIVMKTDSAGIHADEERAVYMEMVFGNGEKIVLSEESSEYQAEMQPKEALSFWFTGEINEYAAKGWEDGGVKVEVVYSWDITEEKADENIVEEENEAQTSESEEAVEEAVEEDELDEEIKVIELNEFQQSEVFLDLWETEESGQILSEQYIVRNTGESRGTFTLSNLVCRAGKESEIFVMREWEEAEEAEERAIYVDLAVGNEERFVLSQEEADYRVELEPGEEISVRFQGEMNWIRGMEEGEGIVSALCFWEMEETADEQSFGIDEELTNQEESEKEYSGNV